MNDVSKYIIATAVAILMLVVPAFVSETDAQETEDVEYDIDLGEFWSYTIGFSPSLEVEGARSITWDFGDGSEPVTAFSHIHTYEQKGVYYVTQTCTNSNGDSVMIAKVTVLGYPYVEFNSMGGSQIAKIDMTSGGINATPAEEPEEIPVKAGYTFTGWYTTSECTELYDWDTEVVEPVTLYAGWSENPKATVSFDVGDGYPPMEAQQVTIGTEFTIPHYDGTLEGWTFGGWTYDGETYLEGQKILITESITLTAVWNELDKYTITFNTDGGSQIPAQSVYVNSTAERPETDPTKQHYTFAGWFTADGTAYDFETPITGNTVIYAHWTPVDYTVSFDVNGGEGTYPDQTVPYGSKATEPATDPTRDDYRFNGWYLNGVPYDFDTPVSGNIELRADWSYIQSPVDRHTVTFDPANGEDDWTSTVVDGHGVTMVVPVRVGYEFAGWFAADGTQYTESTPITSDITLTAHWTAKTVTVTYQDADGSVVTTRTVKHSAYAPSVSMERDGYRFDGWYTADGTAYDFKQRVTSDLTLTAKWTELRDVSVVIDGDVQVTEPIPEDVVPGDSIRLPEASKDGQEFVGWEDQDGQVHQPGETIVIDEDTTLTPVFEDIPEGEEQHTVTIEGAPELNFDRWYTTDGIVVLPELEREGQTHTGWQDKDGNFYEVGDEIVLEGDVTLTPVFEEKQPIDTAIPDIEQDVVLSEELPGTVYEGSEVTLPDASKEGEKFVGWDTDGDGTVDAQPGETIVVDKDTVLEPVFDELGQDDVQHTVTIETGNGEGDYVWYPLEGDDMVLPDPGERPGFEFDGYYDQDGNKVGDAGDVITPSEDSVITGVWDKVADPNVKHKVTFEDVDGTDYRVVDVTEGKFVAQLKAPTKDGFEFVCWTLNGQPYDFRTPVMDDITLVASWKPIHRVDVSLPDGTVVSGGIPSDVTEGDEITLPDASKDGQTLVGWDTDNDGIADAQPGDSVVIDGDTTLTPVFEDLPEDSQQVKVEFGDVGGSDIPYDHWYTEDGKITLPDADRDDQKLVGWDLDGDGQVDAQPGDVVDVPESGRIDAIWETKQDVKVEVAVDEDVSLSGTVPETVKEGDEIVLPDASRPGQVLDGWDTDGDGIVDAHPGDTVVVGSDTVFKPIWSEAEGDQHKVVIDAAGGSAPYDEWYPVEGGSMVLPEPSKDGAGFQGWYTEDGDFVGMPGDTVYPDGDMTLVAHWDEGGDWVVYAVIVIAVVLVVVVVVVLVKKGAIPL